MSRSLYARLEQRFNPRPSISRREFLKITLAASAGLLISSCAPIPTKRDGRKKVVVIGAGFAGLACAHELLHAGYEVVVLEARNRVGGRVLSFRDWVKGKNVEGGGELIGSNHPTWVGYAKQLGLQFLDVTEDEHLEDPIVFDGKLLTALQAKKLYEEMEAAFATMTDAAKAVDEDVPWKSANAVALDKKTAADWIAETKVSPLARRAITAELAANNGAAVESQSFLGNLTQVKGGGLEKYWTESEVYRCRNGNQLLAEKLALKIGARLRLKMPVSSVRIKDDKVEVVSVDGRMEEGDKLVLAIPPSLWPRIRFEPALPAELKPQMGVNVKYLVQVKRRFWKDAVLGPNAATDGMISMTWEGTDNQLGDAPAELTAFSGGPAAEIARQKFRETRNKAYHEELEKLYPKFRENFLDDRFMDWPSDPWTLAGYSFPAPGQITTVGPVLRNGIGRLHFAGEHACYKFVGYMEGALNSGASVARRLAAADKILTK